MKHGDEMATNHQRDVNTLVGFFIYTKKARQTKIAYNETSEP